MKYSHLNISLLFQLFTGIVPLLFLFFTKRKFYTSFILFLTISFISTVLLIITTQFGIRNFFVISNYLILSYLFLWVFFLNIIHKPFRYFLYFFLAIFLIIVCFELCFYQKLRYTLSYSAFNYVLFSILFFVQEILLKPKNEAHEEITKKTIQFVLFSLLIYSSFTFLMSFHFTQFLRNKTWLLHNVMEGLSKILYTYAFCYLPKTNRLLKNVGIKHKLD